MDNAFDGVILGSKVFIMSLLFVLSMVNAYTKFISAQPRKFLGEALIVGLAAAFSFLFIAGTRGNIDMTKSVYIAVLAFLVFFVFHIFMEFSGFNQGAIDESKLGGKLQKQQKVLTSKPVIGVVVILGVILTVMAAIRHDFEGVTPVQLGLEALVFGILNALPTVMISIDRGEKNAAKIAKDTGIMGAAFFAGHILLQAGGFYTTTFRP